MRLYFEKTFVDEIGSNQMFFHITWSVLNGHIQPTMDQFIEFNHSDRASFPLLIFDAKGRNNILNLIENLFWKF